MRSGTPPEAPQARPSSKEPAPEQSRRRQPPEIHRRHGPHRPPATGTTHDHRTRPAPPHHCARTLFGARQPTSPRLRYPHRTGAAPQPLPNVHHATGCESTKTSRPRRCPAHRTPPTTPPNPTNQQTPPEQPPPPTPHPTPPPEHQRGPHTRRGSGLRAATGAHHPGLRSCGAWSACRSCWWPFGRLQRESPRTAHLHDVRNPERDSKPYG